MTWTAPEAPMEIKFTPGTLACFIILAIVVIIWLANDNKSGD
jgi:hypothetical protein